MDVNYNIRIDREIREEFKRTAQANAHNPSALVRKWIEDYIDNNKPEG